MTRMMQKAFMQGKEHEQLFCKLTGAEMGTQADESKHIDCRWKGFTVDVKGSKQSHYDGYVLVEFKNVSGHAGWAEKGPDLIAFMFPSQFIVVKREDLLAISQKKVMANPANFGAKVARSNGVAPETGLYLLIGRPSRKDVFTYIRKSDLLELTHVTVDF